MDISISYYIMYMILLYLVPIIVIGNNTYKNLYKKENNEK